MNSRSLLNLFFTNWELALLINLAKIDIEFFVPIKRSTSICGQNLKLLQRLQKVCSICFCLNNFSVESYIFIFFHLYNFGLLVFRERSGKTSSKKLQSERGVPQCI